MEFARKIKKRKKMDMTPLIDIIFQLVIFFMLSSNFIEMQAMDVSVSNETSSNPKQQNQQAANGAEGKTDVVIGNGSIMLGNNLIDEAKLQQQLKEIAATNPNQRVVIKVEEGVTVQKMVDIVDIAKASGILNLDLK